MNQKFKTLILWALPILLVIALSYQFLSSSNVDSLKSNGTTVAPRNSAVARVSYGISPISENDLNSKIEEISSLDIFKLTNKYFSKPFLSISGNKNICSEISNRWKKNF